MFGSARMLADGTPHATVTAADERNALDQVSNVRFLHGT